MHHSIPCSPPPTSPAPATRRPRRSRGPGFRAAVAFAALTTLAFSAAAQSTPRWTLMDLGRLPSPDVTAIVRDDLDNIYYGTRAGLTIEDRTGGFRIVNKSTVKGGPASDSITALGLDRYRDLWVATDGGGLGVYANGSWRVHTVESTRSGLPDDGVLSLALHREERWVGTRNGFAVLRGSSWTTWTGDRIAGRLPHPNVTAIAVDSAGDVWLGTIGGLVRMRGSSWTRFTPEDTDGGLPHHGITALYVEPDGALWVGTQAGVTRRDRDGSWLVFGPGAGLGALVNERVTAITGGPEGAVWVSLRGGAARYLRGDWTLYTRDNLPGLLTLYVNTVLADATGEIRIGTQKGVMMRIMGTGR
ncbi:MAG TPA: two-component regulator propeller domain-containing protein [Fibrobacteria bacterium]|nr:two-component regulator propeller domain-containing protein [Fibrobacteria bacterium]